MSTREFFIQRWEAELPAFRRVLDALPDGQLAYKPHERSNAAGVVAWQIAVEAANLAELLDKGEIHFEITPYPSKAEILAAWDKSTAALAPKLKAADDAKWAGPAKFFMGGNAVWTDTVEGMCWGYLFDLIHHRGQLSTYIRPMGGKVPSIYGPSGDDQGS